jgi:lipopolysaccharide assembly protein A
VRTLIVILVLAGLGCGVLFAALNTAGVEYDLLFVRVVAPRGLAPLIALLAGWLLGGALAWAGLARAQAGSRGRRGKDGRP